MKLVRYFGSLLCIGTCLALSACTSSTAEVVQTSVVQQDTLPTTPEFITGWAEVEKLKPKFVVFGELHGTRESPLLVSKLASNLAAQGKRVLVAVELEARYDADLQRAWNETPTEFAIRLKTLGWAARKDGVASEAMFEMLVTLHKEKHAGALVSIAAFNSFKDDTQKQRLETLGSQNGHEMAQAENIAYAADASQYDHVLVLVGNMHAQKAEVVRPSFSFKPMVLHLQNSGKVVSLNMLWSGGTAWNCTLKEGMKRVAGSPITADMIDCSNKPMRGLPSTMNAPRLGVGSFGETTAAENYDGYYWLGTVSGSAPAVP